MKTTTLKQKVFIKGAKPAEVYDVLMSGESHSKLTDSNARISDKVGGKFSVWDGGILGENLELIPGKKIVQKWYCETPGWPEEHYSDLTITFHSVMDGTALQLTQKDLPEAAEKDITEGWNAYYWEPLKEMFER